LLEGALLCYKPGMRKWMRDKLRRRKKSQESSEQPAPLQPAYFSAGNQDPAAEQENEERTVDARDDSESQAAVAPLTSEAPAEAAAPMSGSEQEGVRRSRRRRGRGGRGRRRPAQASAGAAAPLPAPQESGTATAVVAPAPPSIHSRTQPATKGIVVLAIGLPGSGKSSWFKRHNINPLSSDMVRALLFDDPTEQRFQELVFSNLRSMLRARLIARRPLNYVDATNLTPHDRHSWIKLAKDFDYEVQAVYFDVPLEVCLERNQRRQRVVSQDVMRKMAEKLKPPTFEEGFSKITVVRVKQKE
jgi:predicted kinase